MIEHRTNPYTGMPYTVVHSNVPNHFESGECELCDGFGVVWNNADPTSGQWAACDCGDTRGHP